MKYKVKFADESVNVSKVHPLKEFATLIVGFSILLASILFIAISFVNIVAPLVPLKTEKAMFAGLKTTTVQENFYGLGRVSPNIKLKALVDKLAQHWPENPYDFSVAVLDSEILNAMAFPGGNIIVSQGLLDEVESENELAFVLAHEIGHFHNRDHLKSLGRGLLTSIILGVFGKSTESLSNVVGIVSTSSYSRKAEASADRFGLELVQAQYGNVSGSTDLFKKLSKNEHNSLVQRYTRSHPISKLRIQEMIDYAEKRNYSLTEKLLPKLIIQ
ncbi:MAG TPA: hypothetical protein ENK21_05235 [Trueperaceae bacterium]|nr:hypothetical protein [Trueperaceae bacterium]